ncbi:MAG: AsmA family protein [Thermodesulfobacteriota bacterium]
MKRMVKGLMWGCAAILLVIILLATAILLAPAIVSTQWAKEQIEHRASTAVHRSVRIDALSWTWKKGIKASGITVEDKPPFSEGILLGVTDIRFKIDLTTLVKRQWVFDLHMDGVNAHLIRQKDGATNLGKLLSDITPAPQQGVRTPETPTKPALPFFLPQDVKATLGIRDLTIRMDDRLQNRFLVIQNGSILVKAPSIQHEPVHLSISSEQKMNQTPLPPLDLTAHISRLVDPAWGLAVKNLSVTAQGTLPGLSFTARGGMSQKELNTKLVLDVEEFYDAASPFMAFPLSDVSGRIEMRFNTSQQKGKDIRFNMSIMGKGLMAEGGPLKKIRVGPLDLDLIHEGIFAPEEAKLQIDSGEIRLQEKTQMSWQGSFTGLETKEPGADLDIGPVCIDFREMADALKGVTPPDVSFTLPGRDNDLKGPRVTIRHMGISGRLLSGQSTIGLQNMVLNIPAVAGKISAGSFRTEDIRLEITHADAEMTAFFPSSLNMDAGLELADLHLNGQTDVRVKHLELDMFRLRTAHMHPLDKAMLGMEGDIRLNSSGTLTQIIAPGVGSAPALAHSLETEITLPPSPGAEVRRAVFSVRAPSLTDIPSMGSKMDQSIRIQGELNGLNLFKGDRLRVDTDNIRTDIEVGNLFTGNLNASFQDLGSKRLETNGNLSCVAEKALPVIPAQIRPKGDMAGNLALDWNFRGRRPSSAEIQTLISGGRPLSTKLRQMQFIHDLEILARLNRAALNLPLSGKGHLLAEDISFPSPFRLRLENGADRAEIDGRLACGKISQIPGLEELNQPIRLILEISMQLKELKNADISQSLDIQPLNIQQTLSGSIDHVDRLLDKESIPDMGAFLSALDAWGSTRINMDLDPLFKDYMDEISAAGSISAGAEAALSGNKDLTLDLTMRASSLNAGTDKVQVKNLDSDIQLKKRFKIVSAGESRTPAPGALPLSREVLRSPSETTSFSESPGALTRRMSGRTYQRPCVTFDAATLPAGPIRLHMTETEIGCDFNRPLPAIDYFQFNILGGTLTGNLFLSKAHAPFMLEMDCAFTGLDAARLSEDISRPLAKETPEGRSDTEVSGHMYLRLPVSDTPSDILDHMSATVRLTHIGPRTLERFLYALDPYESNEIIVKQRRLLRQGTPKWIVLEIKHGNLSLRGEVDVKGVVISLPQINRFNVSLLPVHDRLNKLVPELKHLAEMLKILSADTILIDQGNGLRLTEELP